MGEQCCQAAQERARALLQATAHYDELGHGQLAAEARMVARDSLELAALVEHERSLRTALRERLAVQERLLGKRAYEACEAAAKW